MPKQEITLANVIVNPDSSIEVVIHWNGLPFSQTFPDEAVLRAANESPLTAPPEALKWMLYYLLPLSGNVEALQSKIGQTLSIEVAPAISQTITLS
jgi:hypothetical protein